MISDRHTAIIYTSAICNLKCTYCYIDKNPALKKIDDILDESFKGDYYFNFIREMFPDPNQLTSIETWGGEPFIAMNRCYNLLHQLIGYYNNFNSFFSSTNLTTSDWIDQFSGLVKVFSKYPDKKFDVTLQLSIDGPEYITDMNRGVGVTKKFIENFHKLLEFCKESLPDNIDLKLQPKPTFDNNCIRLMDTKEKIIEYYHFMEGFLSKVKNLNKSNVTMSPNIPNTASPYPHTVEDGRIFANLCRLTREIEKENKIHKYFKFYTNITMYSRGYNCNESMTLKCTNFTCGTGYTNVGFLPYDRISNCHNGFVDLISDYKKLCIQSKDEHTIDFRLFMEKSKSRFCLTKEQYKLYESQMQKYNVPDTTARLSNMVVIIMTLAQAGQILDIYKDPEEALKAARFIRNKTAFCVRDNHAITGSLTLQPVGIFKLLLNGAKEVIEEDEQC